MLKRNYSSYFFIASLVLLGIIIYLPAKRITANSLIPRTYTGMNQCGLVTNRDGEKWAEMWCVGSYVIGGTCTGNPSHRRIFERIPASCGPGSYIGTRSLMCAMDKMSAGYDYYCAATDTIRISSQASPNCTVTCDPGNSPVPAPPELIANCSAQECPIGANAFLNVENCNCGAAVPTPTPTPTPAPTPIPGGCNGVADWGQYPTTGCASGFVYSGGVCTRNSAFINQCDRFGGYDEGSCGCTGGCQGTGCSPIVIDVVGNGFSLTDALNGVNFDVDGDGSPERRSWTSADSDDAWLVRDLNGNGVIDGGRELFGSLTTQPPPPTGIELNGFNALTQYDEAGFGGNGDGQIDNQDTIFSSLRLWQDTNHNGISESSELHTLPELGLRRIDLDYKRSRRVDQFGNQFKYRSKVKDARGAQLGRWAWDVFLVTQP